MFDKATYRETFSRVTASEETFRRVMTMKHEDKKRTSGRTLPRLALVAVLIALMAITVSASETVQNWFVDFFAGLNRDGLSQEQVEYIEENTKTILDSQTHNGWTVELMSAIQDGNMAYVVFRLEAPADIDLDQYVDKYRDTWGNYSFWNLGAEARDKQAQEVVSWSEGVSIQSWGINWREDNDGLKNTKTLLIRLSPYMSGAEVAPFGSDAVYTFHFENIVWEYEDKEYVEELKNGKYKGKENIAYTNEETRRIYQYDLLAEGVWDFTICFGEQEDDSGEYIELLTDAIKVRTNVFRSFGPEIEDYATVEDTVTVTSVRLRHLTVRICYNSIDGTPQFNLYEGDEVLRPVIVMKDGTQLKLRPNCTDGNAMTLEADMPIIFENVSHILMPDGTIIDMPN